MSWLTSRGTSDLTNSSAVVFAVVVVINAVIVVVVNAVVVEIGRCPRNLKEAERKKKK